MHAEICPICFGKGKINAPEITCYGCNGKGWIEVLNGYIYSIPHPQPTPIPWLPYYIPPTIEPYYWKPIIICDTKILTD